MPDAWVRPHKRKTEDGTPAFRRKIPKTFIIGLAKQGYSVREIAQILGKVDGTPFHPASISAVIDRARKSDPSIPRRSKVKTELPAASATSQPTPVKSQAIT